MGRHAAEREIERQIKARAPKKNGKIELQERHVQGLIRSRAGEGVIGAPRATKIWGWVARALTTNAMDAGLYTVGLDRAGFQGKVNVLRRAAAAARNGLEGFLMVWASPLVQEVVRAALWQREEQPRKRRRTVPESWLK